MKQSHHTWTAFSSLAAHRSMNGGCASMPCPCSMRLLLLSKWDLGTHDDGTAQPWQMVWVLPLFKIGMRVNHLWCACVNNAWNQRVLPKPDHVKREENHHSPTSHLKEEENHQPDRAASQSETLMSCLESAAGRAPRLTGRTSACGCCLTSCKEQHGTPRGESTHISCRTWVHPQMGRGGCNVHVLVELCVCARVPVKDRLELMGIS